jgi:hypothetical protein
MTDPEEVRRIKREVEADLLTRPGVVGVDVGYKHTGGRKTDVLAIRVYVAEKKEVVCGETIPAEIQGVPTDVIERRFELHNDESESGEFPEQCGGVL